MLPHVKLHFYHETPSPSSFPRIRNKFFLNLKFFANGLMICNRSSFKNSIQISDIEKKKNNRSKIAEYRKWIIPQEKMHETSSMVPNQLPEILWNIIRSEKKVHDKIVKYCKWVILHYKIFKNQFDGSQPVVKYPDIKKKFIILYREIFKTGYVVCNQLTKILYNTQKCRSKLIILRYKFFKTSFMVHNQLSRFPLNIQYLKMFCYKISKHGLLDHFS